MPDESFIENILRKDKRITGIYRGEEWDIPDISKKLWDAGNQKNLQLLSLAIDFLNEPYILDDFGSYHKARRKWRDDMKVKYLWFSEYYERNALKVNSLIFLNNTLENLVRGYTGKNRQTLQELEVIAISQLSLSAYDLLTAEEKVERVRAVKEKLYDLLQFLGSEKPSLFRYHLRSFGDWACKKTEKSLRLSEESLPLPEKSEHESILIADDSKRSRLVLKYKIQGVDPDIEVYEARSGKELVDTASKTDYTLIIADRCMDDMDGAEAIASIREHNLHTPIIAISAADDYADECMKAGASKFVEKTRNDDLKHILSGYFRMRRLRKRILPYENFTRRDKQGWPEYNNFPLMFMAAGHYSAAKCDELHYRTFLASKPELHQELHANLATINRSEPGVFDKLREHEPKLYEAYRFMRIFGATDNQLCD